METANSPIASLALLPANEDLPDDVIFINPLTPPLHSLPALDQQLWGNIEPEKSEDKLSASERTMACPVETSSCVNMEQEDTLFVVEATPPVQVSSRECSVCGKVFGTTNALNKHLLTHQPDRPHVCSICQRAFKRHDHLTGHMLTHQKRKSFRCTQPGCQKSYCDYHSLKRHCVTQHGVYLFPPPSQSLPSHLNQSGTARWDPEDTVSSLQDAPGNAEYQSHFLSLPKPTSTSTNQLEGSAYAEFAASYDGYADYPSLAGTMGINQYPEDMQPHDLKSLLIQDTWRLGTSRSTSDSENMDRMAPTQGSLHASVRWAAALESCDTRADPMATLQGSGMKALSAHGWDTNLNFPVSDLQATWEEMLAIQPCREGASGRMEEVGDLSPPTTQVQHRVHRPILLKHNVQQAKPQKWPEPPGALGSVDGSVSAYPEPSTSRSLKAPSSTFGKTPSGTPPPPTTVNKRKRVKKKAKKKVNNVPAPPLPVPQPNLASHRRPRPRPAFLVSPSQVAMASFNTDSAPCPSVKGASVTGIDSAREEQQFDNRCPSECSAQTPPSLLPDPPLPTLPSEPSATLQQPSSEPLGSDLVETVACDEAKPTEEGAGGSETMRLSPLLFPVSVPVAPKTDSSLGNKDGNSPLLPVEKQPVVKGSCKRNRSLEPLRTLIIPPPWPPPCLQPSDGGALDRQRCKVTGGYPSQLRSPTYLADHLLNASFQPPPYTPPPMLSPLRPGTGLYFSTMPQYQPCAPPPGTYTAMQDGLDGICMTADNTIINIEPRINVGSRFQAEIPPLRNTLLMLYEEHPAQLVWAPWGNLSSNTDTQDRVSELLDMCCSSVLPGGGTNTELALHCLHEVQGDILAALDLLLVRGDYRTSAHPLSSYHYSGSDHWTAQEKRLFRKALGSHEKDFQLIHNELKTKSVFQCVEYYYAMKKLKKFKQLSRGADRKDRTGTDSSEFSKGSEENTVGCSGAKRHLTRHTGPRADLAAAAADGVLDYTCEECGRGFKNVKSRSAHMKTHRQQVKDCPMPDSWSSGKIAQS